MSMLGARQDFTTLNGEETDQKSSENNKNVNKNRIIIGIKTVNKTERMEGIHILYFGITRGKCLC